ncbi:MAG: hypothetical protein PHR64_00710 [Candidatus Shapirobacteria bacterium]|nr:hypothetical protein [Candidatus Shapirobacteria bacterium]MDD5074001.1 hypothetical protein [Candidatus Shapirobacteria bacterium]MDD5481458.1 hypothetical protein [Candidatus Shapirobacteria bacterium]
MIKKTALTITAVFLLFIAGPVLAQESLLSPSPTAEETPETGGQNNIDSEEVLIQIQETTNESESKENTITPSPKPTPTEFLPNSNLITISPPVRELELPRGSANSYQMSLTNRSQKTVTLVLRASPFVASGDTGGVDVTDDPLPDSQNWVVINPSVVTLEAGEQIDVTYTILIPQNAEPGGFYFAVTALLSGDANVAGQLNQITTGSAVDLNVAALNLITIEGPVDYSAQISEFSTPKILFEYGPVPFVTRILNLSNVHIKPILEIEIGNTWGLENNSLVHLERQNILPQSQRKFEAEFGGKWHFGRYSATLNALYGDGQTLSYTIFFWIMPWKIILAVLLALAIIILLILSIKRQLDEKKILEEELKKIQTPEQEK